MGSVQSVAARQQSFTSCCMILSSAKAHLIFVLRFCIKTARNNYSFPSEKVVICLADFFYSHSDHSEFNASEHLSQSAAGSKLTAREKVVSARIRKKSKLLP